MHKTVVAVFNDQQEAERARHEVLHAGFSFANVVIHSGAGRTGSATEGQSTVQEDHGGIGGWFRSLFNINEDDENVRLYAQAVRRGQCVLSIHVNDEEEAERAHQILQRYDAVDPDAPDAQAGQRGGVRVFTRVVEVRVERKAPGGPGEPGREDR